jgi:hypothetical protein
MLRLHLLVALYAFLSLFCNLTEGLPWRAFGLSGDRGLGLWN